MANVRLYDIADVPVGEIFTVPGAESVEEHTLQLVLFFRYNTVITEGWEETAGFTYRMLGGQYNPTYMMYRRIAADTPPVEFAPQSGWDERLRRIAVLEADISPGTSFRLNGFSTNTNDSDYSTHFPAVYLPPSGTLISFHMASNDVTYYPLRNNPGEVEETGRKNGMSYYLNGMPNVSNNPRNTRLTPLSITPEAEIFSPSFSFSFTDRDPNEYLHRHYDLESVYSAMDNATSVSEAIAQHDDFENAYGISLSYFTTTSSRYPATTYTRYNYYNILQMNRNWSPDVLVLQHYKDVLDEITKWVPGVVDFTTDQLIFTDDLLNPSGTQISGVSFNDEYNRFVLDMLSSENEFDFPVEGHFNYSAFTVHHELHHRFTYNWSGFDGMESDWTALNPLPYGSEDPDADPATRPPGFFRNYSMTSFREDMADIFGALMYTPTYWAMQKWRRTDPALDGKIEMMNLAVASATGNLMGTQGYYDAIHGTTNPYATGVSFQIKHNGVLIPATPHLWSGGQLTPVNLNLHE